MKLSLALTSPAPPKSVPDFHSSSPLPVTSTTRQRGGNAQPSVRKATHSRGLCVERARAPSLPYELARLSSPIVFPKLLSPLLSRPSISQHHTLTGDPLRSIAIQYSRRERAREAAPPTATVRWHAALHGSKSQRSSLRSLWVQGLDWDDDRRSQTHTLRPWHRSNWMLCRGHFFSVFFVRYRLRRWTKARQVKASGSGSGPGHRPTQGVTVP